MSLRLDYCDHKAATYAVMNWHYSKRMPIGKMVRVGVWEHQQFIGCVLFARGNSPTLGNSYGLDQTEVCELVRVALQKHEAPVSRILSVAIKLLREVSPGTKLIVSFADPEQGHVGSIYQASGWTYTGKSNPTPLYFHEGRWKHRREVTGGAFGKAPKLADRGKSLPCRVSPPKYRYLYPLTEELKDRVTKLSKPYPKKKKKGNAIPA